ncbi:MAG: hypothetical protein ACHQJ6_04340 [Candidatus Berkiellales bacterium]
MKDIRLKYCSESYSVADFAKNIHDEVERTTHSEGKNTTSGDQSASLQYIRGGYEVGGDRGIPGKILSLLGLRNPMSIKQTRINLNQRARAYPTRMALKCLQMS